VVQLHGEFKQMEQATSDEGGDAGAGFSACLSWKMNSDIAVNDGFGMAA